MNGWADLIKTISYLSVLGAFAPLIGFAQCVEGESSDYSHDAEVFMSTPTYTFEVGCRVLFLKPSGSTIHYGVEAEHTRLSSPSWKIHDIEPEYHVGFDLGVSTVFPCRNANVMLNWEHFHSKDTSRRSVKSKDMIGPLFEIAPDCPFYQNAKGKTHVQYDAITLNGGILINLGSYLQANIYAGINGTRIKQTVTAKYSSITGIFSRSISIPSTFAGMGPQLGVDFAYNFSGGFNLTGGATASLLVGSLKNCTTFKSVCPALNSLDITPPNTQGIKVNHRNQVVPAFSGKLGLAYTYASCGWALTIEAGYEAKIYINAIQSTDIGSEVLTRHVPNTIGVHARTFQRNLSTFALSGPYASINIYF